MALRAAPAFSLLNPKGVSNSLLSPFGSSSSASKSATGHGLVVFATKASANSKPLTGVVFEPFEELKKELMLVPTLPQASIARHKYSDDCEAAINEQIKWVFLRFSSLILTVEYNVSYVYHAMYAYFDRDNIAHKGLAKFFKESSEEEREHAEKFMEYQNKRGGKVKLQSILMPLSEFDHAEKGDALYDPLSFPMGTNCDEFVDLAMELALSLEKLTNEKLLTLHAVASRNNDVQLADFVESEFLGEQVEAIKKMSEYVAQLRRVGKGHGVWHFDKMLLHEEA
ncbi:hypothetical protein RHSIM_Rhsim03G0146700 [Rhododendron simsii]|uniref:Ferritin n=1 Tax=Rhododendron simsii TaxID=118357 RepID=A0A834H6W8_RHOSS|nr:hypothetical protein RHSIM_Rhsim03G0146700 [Rhododendron simsii]